MSEFDGGDDLISSPVDDAERARLEQLLDLAKAVIGDGLKFARRDNPAGYGELQRMVAAGELLPELVIEYKPLAAALQLRQAIGSERGPVVVEVFRLVPRGPIFGQAH